MNDREDKESMSCRVTTRLGPKASRHHEGDADIVDIFPLLYVDVN